MKQTQAVAVLWQAAVIEAVGARSEHVEPEHFFEALTKGKDFCRQDALKELRAKEVDTDALARELSLVPDMLEAAGANPAEVRRSMRAAFGSGIFDHGAGKAVHRSERARRIFSAAEALASASGKASLDTITLSIALLRETDSLVPAVLRQKGCHPSQFVETLEKLLRGQNGKPAKDVPGSPKENPKPGPSTPVLERFGRDLTKEAREGRLAPVIGRRKEILQVMQTLARSTKCNPVLVGEPGVGKTAVVEALAQRIAVGKDDQVFTGTRIVEISMGRLVAGIATRGELEERVQGFLAEATAASGLILFIDEIHTMVGAGDERGGSDVANLMKPVLARGAIRCIGATTLAEYRRYIEKDPALERRFDVVIVDEPSREEAIQILEGISPRLAKHHSVQIRHEAMAAAVDLSIRFDSSHRLPDKAIDLLDLACARCCVPALSIQGRLGGTDEKNAREISPAIIIDVLSDKTGIPSDVIATGLKEGHGMGLAGLKDKLLKRVIGQDHAVGQVCNRLLLARAALGERRGPLGVFLFLGPSGVGKTELARTLAETLFGAERNLIRLDMSEFMEHHNVARLIGSPPGYRDSDTEGQLTGRLRTTPYAIVLLDEVEKAHPKVFDLFLQVFDEGRLTDAKGRTVDARNAIFIMTSNIRIEGKANKAPLGFDVGRNETGNSEMEVADGLKKFFRIELINRIDEIVQFMPLSKTAIAGIAESAIDGIKAASTARYRKALAVSPDVIAELCRRGYSPETGARNLRRVIQEAVEAPLAQLLLSPETVTFDRVTCCLEDGRIVVRASD